MDSSVFSTTVFPQDRRAALRVAGVLEILFGVGACLLTGWLAIAAQAAARQGAIAPPSVIPSVVLNGIIGTIFVVLGIGSLRARRWARDLWLVISAGWLAGGIVAVIFSGFWLPMDPISPLMDDPTPTSVSVGALLSILVILGLVLLGMPFALYAFYRSPNVRATCESAQPGRVWTDACPLRVLAAAVWLGLMSIMMLGLPFAYGGLFPFFGVFARDEAGVGLWCATALLAAAAALGLYRQRLWAWWLAMGLILLFGVSGVLTSLSADIAELYRGMGIQGAQLEQLEELGLASPGYMLGSTVGMFGPYLLLLVWIRPQLLRMDRRRGSTTST
jgi:hypothetical protein